VDHRSGPREPGAGTAPLGNYGTLQAGPGQGLAARESRHRLKAVQREVTGSVSSQCCGFPMGTGPVEVAVGRSWVAHVANVSHCGSAWSCPTCAPVVRIRRSLEIAQGVARWQEMGGSVLFVTLTMPHAFGDPLEPRLAVLGRALRSCFTGQRYRELRDALGIEGSIRAPEVTDGENGWHPHLHLLLFVAGGLGADLVESFRSWLYGRWSAVVGSHGFGQINSHGLDVRATGGGSDRLAEYMQAVEGGWSMGAELTQATAKRSRTAVDSLRLFAQSGDLSARARWIEWEGATFGKSSCRWSKGLRARLLPDVVELTDQEAASAEGLGRWLVKAFIDGGEWVQLLKSGESGSALRELVEVAFVLVMMSELAGHVPAERE